MNMESLAENFKIRTAYNDIRVCRHLGLLEFRSHDNALQSVIDPQAPERLCLRNLEQLMTALLFIPLPRHILMLGTAAGSLLHYLRHYLPETRVTAVDIDAELVEQLLRREILPPAGEYLEYLHADAAEFISDRDSSFDLVLVDLFQGTRSPAWLLQPETGQSLHRICAERGAVSYNLLIASDYDFRQFYRDLRRLYGDRTLSLPVQGFENRIVCAVRGQRAADAEMNALLEKADALSARLGIDFRRLLSVAYNSNPAGNGLI